MKPVNAPERRKAFIAYLFIFVITLIPICLSIYLYGRVDHAENAFLREKYEEKRKLKGEMSNERTVYLKLESSAFELKQNVTQLSDRATISKQAGNIDSRIQEVEAAIMEFKSNTYNAGLASATDSALVRILDDQLHSLKTLSSIYRDTFDELDRGKDKFEELEDSYKRLQQECK